MASPQLVRASLLALRGGGDASLDSEAPADGASTIARGRNANVLARLHPLPGDEHLTFDEASHTYHVKGATIERSVTALVTYVVRDPNPGLLLAL